MNASCVHVHTSKPAATAASRRLLTDAAVAIHVQHRHVSFAVTTSITSQLQRLPLADVTMQGPSSSAPAAHFINFHRPATYSASEYAVKYAATPSNGAPAAAATAPSWPWAPSLVSSRHVKATICSTNSQQSKNIGQQVCECQDRQGLTPQANF